MTNFALSYDDVTLIPQYSEIISRSDPDTTTVLSLQKHPPIELKIPIISANMDTVTESEMAIAMGRLGGMGAIHRFSMTSQQIEEFKAVQRAGQDCFMSLGVGNNAVEAYVKLYDAGARKFIIDIAHGHSVLMKDMIAAIRSFGHSDTVIMAGNVATGFAVRDLVTWGADIIKVGVGGGSICKTRVVTGHGVPMFSCVQECATAADNFGVPIVADGGIRSSGDIVKAFAAGADAVMIGSLLAGTNETPGDIEIIDGHHRKRYRGMASAEAQGNRQWGSNGVKAAPEGVSTFVDCKGPVENTINELVMGLKSGMSYCNASKLSQIHTRAHWVQQSHAGYIEGTPHILR